MAKKKIQNIELRSSNGITLPDNLRKFAVYFEGTQFFAYIPQEYALFAKPGTTYIRYNDKSKENTTGRPHCSVINGNSPDDVQNNILYAINQFHNENIKEEKVIVYEIKYNSKKQYFNHNKSISFCDTPALSLYWSIQYLITYPDGRQMIFSAPYKGFGNICSPKSSTSVDKMTKQWMIHTEQREAFFQNTENSMEEMIKRVVEFFAQPSDKLLSFVDNNQKLIG